MQLLVLVLNSSTTLLAILLYCSQLGGVASAADNPTAASRLLSVASSTVSSSPSRKSWYEQKVDRYYHWYKIKKKWEQIQQGRKIWPKKKGRCEHSPWVIDGVNPVMEESKRGILLFKSVSVTL